MATGPGEVLDLLRRKPGLTRGDVLEATGLSRVTVSQRVDALLQHDFIVEGGAARSTGGRRSRTLNFNAAKAHVIAASIETTHVRVAVSDLEGRLLADRRREAEITESPPITLDLVHATARDLMTEMGLDAAGLCGMGVSIPGPVDPNTGRPSQPPMLPGWDAFPIAEHLRGLLDVPVVVSNDADAEALGEYAVSFPDSTALCQVKVSTGIGLGLVIDGRIYHGVDGGSGDIGHVRVSNPAAQQAMCQCGARGCLATIASGRAVARQLRELGVRAESGRDVERLLQQGDPQAAALTQEAGRQLGEVLATVVCLFNPGVMVIGGALSSAPLIAGIRESLYRLSLPRATRHLTMHLSTIADGSALVGLVHQVVSQEFAPERINERLG